MQRAAGNSSGGRPYKTARLVGMQTGAVRSLPGFKKGLHREPQSANPAAHAFVRQAGAAQLTAHLDGIFKDLRGTMGYKRRQLTYSDDGGAASIKTPDFDVHLWLESNPASPGDYQQVTEVSAFRRPEVIGEPLFQSIFNRHIDRVVVDFMSAIDVAAEIDRWEERADLAGKVEDEPNGSSFKVTLDDPPVELHVNQHGVTVKLASGQGLAQLVEQSNRAIAILGRL
jgi:hypothetical protein